MSNIIKQQQQLSQLLASELKDTYQLLEILYEEHQALGASDPDLISAISIKKLNALQQVEQHQVKRSQFLSDIGLPSNSKGIDSLIKRLPKESLITAQWQELMDVAEKLRHQNEINGGIIALTQRHITLALDILNGKTNVTSTYGRRGQTHSEDIPQHIAKA